MATDTAEVQPGPSAGDAPLFAQVEFCIVRSHALKEEVADKLAKSLEDNGAVQRPLKSSDGRVPLDGVTHIVSVTSDFPDYDTAISALIPVVKPDWVESSITKRRLANPRQYSPDPKLFFSGLVVCCADLPSGDKDAILGGVLAMGGLHSGAVTRMVTHIVALTIDNDKCKTAISKGLNCKIVLPHWFDDCLKLGKRIEEGPYLLPDPEILRKRPEDHIPEAGRPDLQGASSARPNWLPTPAGSPHPSRRDLRVFQDKKVMLSADLEIGSHLRGTLEDLVTSGGGNVTGSVYKADIFICHYRENQDFRIASRAGKDVGNLSWLYHLITHNTWTSPLRRLLHYPIARRGLPGFKDFRISLSNYNGEARVYLENLAKVAGGEFTKTMKQDNTHLITAHLVSEKCDAAKEWNINMVNHLWLEESYAKWQIQTLANPRYTHFPPRTNLGEVVGQTQIDKHAVERFFFPKGSDIDPAVEDGQLPRPMRQKDQNFAPVKVSNSSAVQPASSARDPEPNLAFRSDEPTPKATKEIRRHSEGAHLRTPAASRFTGQGKENETPSTTGSRGAKDRAVARLHDLAPDIALYEKERKRVGGVMYGGRRTSEEKVEEATRKRSISTDNDRGTEGSEQARESKRMKKAKGSPSMRLMLSGYKRWVAQPRREHEERARLRDLGILVTQDPANCTHVAAPNIVRTQKFVTAIAFAPVILSADYVEQCLAKSEKLPPEKFPLQDTEGEKRLGFKLSDAIKRAKANKHQLLQDTAVYCTENIRGGFDTYKSIVEVNGGKCMLYRARAGSITSARGGGLDGSIEGTGPAKDEYVYLISGTTSDEARLWPKFRQAVQGVGKVPRIVRTDWILDLALSQQSHWRTAWELTDKDVDS